MSNPGESQIIEETRGRNMHTTDRMDMREACTRVSRDSVARGAAPAYDCHLSVCRELSYRVDRVCCVVFWWFLSFSQSRE